MFQRRQKEPPITRDEVTDLIRLLMTMDWKLNLILEELGVDRDEGEH